MHAPVSLSTAIAAGASRIVALPCQLKRQARLICASQVVSRLHHADFVFALSAVAAALERLAKEFRNLQRSEISETSEGFGEKQVGF